MWEAGQSRIAREYEALAASVQRGYTDAQVSAQVWTPVDQVNPVKRDDARGFTASGSLAQLASAMAVRFPDKVRPS